MNNSERCHDCFEERSDEQSCQCGWDNSQQNTDLQLQAGQKLKERYVLGKVLGEGSFGITYLGWDEALNIKVVVKEYLYTPWASRLSGTTAVKAHIGKEGDFSEGINSFLNEARTLAQLNQHFHAVRDFFRANGTGYWIMNYEDGITLKQHLAKQPNDTLLWSQALPIFIQVIDALHAAHTINLIHGDISPDNIYLSTDGTIKLLHPNSSQFCEVKNPQRFSMVLRDGYSPPEQYSRKIKQGPWTDIYAFGATLYRALTGFAPPDAMKRLTDKSPVTNNPKKAVLSYDPEENEITKALNGIPIKLATIVRKAIALNPEDRFQTVGDLQKELLDIQQHQQKKRCRFRKKPSKSKRRMIAIITCFISTAVFCCIIFVIHSMLFGQ